MKPLINWEELRRLLMPQVPPGGKESSEDGMWERSAAFYNRMAKMEREYTYAQILAFDPQPEDTVLDVGCGPGRISTLIAPYVKSVTAIDSSPAMLKFCKENAKELGVDNIDARLLDWQDPDLDKKLEKHDIVIASRSVGMMNLEKLTGYARKYAVCIAWANAPNIPEISGYLFKGIEIPGQRKMPPMCRDRRLGYNVVYNMVYDLGYDPNIKIVKDGFTKKYTTREEAYADLRLLRDSFPEDQMPVFRNNVDKFLTENADGSVTYRCETKSYVLWWKPERNE